MNAKVKTKGRARAWVTDAQTISDESSAQSELSILIRNGGVDSFLSSGLCPSTAVVGPKGFGKTFVLKSKRVSLAGHDVQCLPIHSIVDRPTNNIPPLHSSAIRTLASSEAWLKLWETSISLVLLKDMALSSRVVEPMEVLKGYEIPEYLQKTMKSISINSTFGVLNQILSMGQKQIEQTLAKSYKILEAMVSQVRDPVVLFVDNVDEYVDPILSGNSKQSVREERYELWHNAQIGLWKALRQINGVNPRVRIFTTIRKEAYHFAKDREPQIQNLDEFKVQLSYTDLDLRQIIQKNIEADTNLASPSELAAMTRFVGKAANQIVSNGTGELEDLESYWMRHCVGRPRDVVAIGKAISEISPPLRNPGSVREAINTTAVAQVEKLFTEAKFHISGLEPDLLTSAITSNVMSPAEVEAGSKAYSAEFEERHPERLSSESKEHEHIFCLLYSLGLIGTVQANAQSPGSYVQSFKNFGEIPLGKYGILPKADEFLVHPGLSDFVLERNAKFLDRLDQINIVGNGNSWRSADQFVYVVAADIESYRRKVLQDPQKVQVFDDWWASEVARVQSSQKIQHCEASSGDYLVLADSRAERLLRACSVINARLESSRYKLRMRFAGHCGFWKLGDENSSSGGPLIATAARIERFGVPGELIVSGQFFKGIAEDTLLDETEFSSFQPESSSVSGPDATVNISKASEEPEHMKLWRLPL